MKSCLVLFLLFIHFSLHAALKYQQDYTISNWKSQQDLEKQVKEFCDAAKDDSDIKIMNIKFEQKKIGKNDYIYNAILTCYVSEVDNDLIRIQAKIFENLYREEIK